MDNLKSNPTDNTDEITQQEDFGKEKSSHPGSRRSLFEIDFEIINMQEGKLLRLPTPSLINEFVSTLKRQNILILAGDPGIDKSDLAICIASRLNLEIKQEHNQSLEALQWTQRCNPQTLVMRVGGTPAAQRSVFLLTRITPYDLANTFLENLKDNAAPHHYIIISTENSISDWQKHTRMHQMYWRELQPQGFFNTKELVDIFIERLLDKRGCLPEGIQIDSISPNTPISEHITPNDLIQRLSTFNNILIFLGLLLSLDQPVNDGIINNLIDQACMFNKIPPDQAFVNWYHALDQRHKLLVLNIGLFQGMRDNQFFSTVEQMFNHVWSRRDPHLRSYDYDDLATLEPFCTQIPTKEGDNIIQMRIPGNDQNYKHKWNSMRQILLKTAWTSQRRQILSSLPEMVKIVKNSVNNPLANLELFGLETPSVRLREIIGETISEIGMIDAETIQITLFILAADTDIRVKLTAAKAMARWRYFNQHELLFQTLRRWQIEPSVIDIFRSILGVRGTSRQDMGQEHIEATIALTVGFAATYDPPNQVHNNLIDLFQDLAKNNKKYVRLCFCNYTLPCLTRHHLVQIQSNLRLMTENIDLDWPIAASLAFAYSYNPDEVLKTLNLWYSICQQDKQKSVDTEKVALRETTIATIALTYGEIDYSIPHKPLTLDESFKQLLDILNKEAHPIIRNAVGIAIASLAVNNFDQVESHIKKVVDKLSSNERQVIITIFMNIYKQQRADLQGGSDRVLLKGHYYPVWHSSPRPQTSVEQAMQRWIDTPKNPIARQMAFSVLRDFDINLEQPIEELAKQKREKNQHQKSYKQKNTLTPKKIASPAKKSDWYTHFLVPFLAAPFSSRIQREKLQSLLPEALETHRSKPTELGTFLDNLESKDQTYKPITKYLRRAIIIAERGWITQIALLLALIFLLYVSIQIIAILLSGI